MRAHEKWRGFSARSAFDQLDPTSLDQFGNCRFGAPEQPYFEPAQGKIRGSSAPAVAGAQNRNFTYAHEIIFSGEREVVTGQCRGAACCAPCVITRFGSTSACL